MQFQTRRLRIDALRADDAEAFFSYRADPVVVRYQGWYPANLDAAHAFIDAQSRLTPGAPGWAQRAIRLHDGTLIGDLGVCLPEDPDGSAEFGVSLAPARQGQGFAIEAVRAVFDWLFAERDMRRIVASVDPRNDGSMTLLGRLGMRQEAHFREAYLLRGEWVDDVVFAMLAREWAAASADSR